MTGGSPGAEPCALVVFGITGDLARKKLLPAVCSLHGGVCCPRTSCWSASPAERWTDGDFEDMAGEAAQAHARTPWQEDVWSRLAGNIRFVPGAFDDDHAFDQLCACTDEMRDQHGIKGNAAFYLSIHAGRVPHRAQAAGPDRDGGQRAVRRLAAQVVVEKPFGHDLESTPRAQRPGRPRLHARGRLPHRPLPGRGDRPRASWPCNFANQLFEPVWNVNYIDSVQITMAEDVGIGTRAGFYDETGAARDVLQNHVLQLLALVAMEEPIEFTPRRSGPRRSRCCRPSRCPEDPRALPIPRAIHAGLAGRRAGGGIPAGEGRPAGVEDGDVHHDQARHRDPPRWAGVRSTLRTGKRLPRRVTEISILFKKAPHLPFLQDRHRGTGAQPAGHPGAAGRGRHAEVRLEGARLGDGGPGRLDGLPLRRGVHRGQPERTSG